MAFFKSDTGNIIADYQEAPIHHPLENLSARFSEILVNGDEIIDASGHDDSCSHAVLTKNGRCFTTNYRALHPTIYKPEALDRKEKFGDKLEDKDKIEEHDLPLFVKKWEKTSRVGDTTWTEINISQLKNPIRIFCYMNYLVVMTKDRDLHFTGACSDNISYGSFSKIGSEVVDVIYPINEGVLFWCKYGEIWFMRRDGFISFDYVTKQRSNLIRGSPERLLKLEEVVAHRPIKFIRMNTNSLFVKFRDEERVLVLNYRKNTVSYLSDLDNYPKEIVRDIGTCCYGSDYYILTTSGRCFIVQDAKYPIDPNIVTEIVSNIFEGFIKIYKLRDEVYLFTKYNMFWNSPMGFNNRYCFTLDDMDKNFKLFNKDFLFDTVNAFGKVAHVYGMPDPFYFDEEDDETNCNQTHKKQKI